MESGIDHEYAPAAWPPFAVTVDVVVLTIRRDALQVLLIERGGEPFRGGLALPGGFVGPDEDLDAAAARELAEETGLRPGAWPLEQIGAYGAPGRDPRMRVVTVAYLAICTDLPAPRRGGDAAAAGFRPVEEIERGAVRLAFDHGRIVMDAVRRTRSRLEHTALAAKFCPPAFTIFQLRRVYEVVWGVRLDPGNFHRGVQESGAFERGSGTAPAGASGRGRRGRLWSVRGSTAADPFAAPLRRRLARRAAEGRRPGGGAETGPPRPPETARLPRREYAARLREVVGRYDHPKVFYDFRRARERRCEDVRGVEERIGALLRSRDPGGIRDGLSNVLYWGYARQPGRRDFKVRAFRDATPVGDPRLRRFAELVDVVEDRPASAASALLDVRRSGLHLFGQMSFATKILMFLDPRFPVLDLRLARAFARGGFEPLTGLRFGPGGIRVTANNTGVYARWACWCREIARLADAETKEAPGLRAVDVERALFVLADEPGRGDPLLAGPEGWTFTDG